MKIMVSACLIGENCKYSGGNNKNQAVLRFLEGHEVIPVCPEIEGGLPVPRDPAEIVKGVVTTCSGNNVDQEYRTGAQKCLEIADKEKIDLAILQSRSPSCGVKQIYDGTFSKNLISGQGIFAKMLQEAGFEVIDSEDL